MPHLPETENALFLRTDFSDDEAWQALCAEVQEPVAPFGFRAYVHCLSEPQYDGLRVGSLPAHIAPHSDHGFMFLADTVTFSHPERPILVVDLEEEPLKSFRVIPSELWAVENNLSIANMDFMEFAGALDADGIFRGFEEEG
jgi:hypothetical protein